jgi:hypothetical protein
MNATSSRVTVRAPDSYRLSGVDGTLNGFIRPHPGFNEVHRFRSSDWGGNHDNSSVIVNCFPFTFVIGLPGHLAMPVELSARLRGAGHVLNSQDEDQDCSKHEREYVGIFLSHNFLQDNNTIYK